MDYFNLFLLVAILALVGNNAKKLERIEQHLGSEPKKKDDLFKQ